MQFNAENENTIKEFFNSNQKLQFLKEVEEKVRKINTELNAAVGTEYSVLVDACESLDALQEKIIELKSINVEAEKLAEKIVQVVKETKEQEEELEQRYQKMSEVQKELNKIENFILMKVKIEEDLKVIEDEKYVDELYFRITKNIKEMEDGITLFRKYYFFGIISENLNAIKVDFDNVLQKNVKEFLDLDWTAVGKGIKVYKEFKLFDEINAEECKVCTKKLADTLYSIRALDYTQQTMIEFVDSYRKGLFENQEGFLNAEITEEATRKAREEGLLCFYIGNVLLSNFLLKKLSKIETFYDRIFSNLLRLKYCNMELLRKMRIMFEKMQVSSPDLDIAVEMLVHNHFENEFKDFKTMKVEKAELLKKIDESFEFLALMNSYDQEFDEIFAKKLDDSIVQILESESTDNFFEKLEEIKEIVEKIKDENDFFKDYTFTCATDIEKSIRRVVREKINELKRQGIDADTEVVVKKILSFKEMENKEFRKEFTETLKKEVDDVFKGRPEDDKTLFIDTAERNLGNRR